MFIFYSNSLCRYKTYLVVNQRAVSLHFGCLWQRCEQVLNDPDQTLLNYQVLSGGNAFKVLDELIAVVVTQYLKAILQLVLSLFLLHLYTIIQLRVI